MALCASVAVVAALGTIETSNTYQPFYRTYAPGVPARLSSRAAWSEVARCLGCWFSRALGLSIFRLRPKGRGSLSMKSGSFTSGYCYFCAKTKKPAVCPFCCLSVQAAQPIHRLRAIQSLCSTAPQGVTSFVLAVSRTRTCPPPCIARIPALFSASSQ
jgi:hypothetical protein